MRYKQTSRQLFDTLYHKYLIYLYDLNIKVIKLEELDYFCYAISVTCILRYNADDHAQEMVGCLTEIMWEKYPPSFSIKLKQRYDIYQPYLDLYFNHQKTVTGLDPVIAIGITFLNFITEEREVGHIYVVDLVMMMHKIIFSCMNKIIRDSLINSATNELYS